MKTPEEILEKLSSEAVNAMAKSEPPRYWPLFMELRMAKLTRQGDWGVRWSKRGHRVRNWLLGVRHNVV